MTDPTTVGTLLVNDALPEDMRRQRHVLNKEGVHKLFTELADKHPEQYSNVLRGLSDVGSKAAWTEGVSVSLSSLRKSKAKEQILAPVRQKLRQIIDNSDLSDDDRHQQMQDLLTATAKPLEDAVFEESKREGSPFVQQIESGARGKKSNLTSMRGADLMSANIGGHVVPIPILNSYAEGLTPAQYFAAAHGQRAGSVGTKLATADAGYLSKKLVGASHRQVVTKDLPTPSRLPVGLPVDTDDRDNIGSVLAKDVGKYKAGDEVTPDMLEDLKDAGVDELIIHSPMTEITDDGGVSRLAAGRRTRAGLSQIGDNIGIPAAQSIGEQLSQGSLSSKHSSKAKAKAERGGIEYLNRLIESPENFPEAGPLSEEDGQVMDVRSAPQGGHYVKVNDRDYYAGPETTPTVKTGDTVEQGDDLTDGVPHPTQLVRLRGMGEARRVYAKVLREGLANSGVNTNRRNVESVVAGLLNWGRVTSPEGLGDNIYDDVVPWNKMSAEYKPRADAQEHQLNKAVGQYLEEPALHYTPGTRVTKKVAAHLQKHGIDKAIVHPEPIDVEPEMVRGVLGVYHDPDWRTRLSGFYTSSAFEKAVHRGLSSDTNSTSYVPGLTSATNSFGRQLGATGKYGMNS